MKKAIILLAFILLGGITASAQANLLSPDGTYVYEKRDTCDLFLDIYYPAKGSPQKIDGVQKPTIVFMFGGGFVAGTRDDQSYNSWFRMLTENGYRVISIDYRLGLKGSSKVGIAQVNVLDKAIHMAVEDLFSATNFIIDNAESLGVDPKNIIISGSSAGAISVMQAEYELANNTSYIQPCALLTSHYLYKFLKSMSPLSNALTNNSALAKLVASGILCLSHK